MVHEKTIEAYKATGVDFAQWKLWHEKGNDVVVRERKEQIKKDKNQVVKIQSVYRKRVDDDNESGNTSEVILWWQQTTGKTGLGNPVSYTESPIDICMWFEPVNSTHTRFNAETEEMETVINHGDYSEVKKHYLYPFNKENIEMIKKMTSNNSKCSFAVMNQNGKSREVPNFEDWSTKDFDTLLNPPKQPLTRAELDRLLGLGLQHQTQDPRPQYH